ncbi:hypothetical protein A2U01_0057519, partial [Trifolium medium]|nr:hypothetical protein [Trifolium medium]
MFDCSTVFEPIAASPPPLSSFNHFE